MTTKYDFQRLGLPVGYHRQQRSLWIDRGVAGLRIAAVPMQQPFELSDPAPRIVADDTALRLVYPRFAPMLHELFNDAATPWHSLRLPQHGVWSIRVAGGVRDVEVDMLATRLQSLHVSGGAQRMAIVLPRVLAGTVPIVIEGGSRDLRLLRPRGTAMDLEIRGGIRRATVDGMSIDAACGPLLRADATAGGRYAVHLEGGAVDLDIRTFVE